MATNDIVTDYNIGIEAKEYEGYLMMDGHQKALDILRCDVDKGLSCGGDYFIGNLGKITGRDLRFRKV